MSEPTLNREPPERARAPGGDGAFRAPRIGTIGFATWDNLIRLPRFPAVGTYEIVAEELAAPGGTSTNTAIALARLGAEVRIAAAIGADAEGEALRRALIAAGVDTSGLVVRVAERTDRTTILVTDEPPDRTILWHRGTLLRKGDRLDLATLLDQDVLVIDIANIPLRRWLLDLPAHSQPRARLLGSLAFLSQPHVPDAFELALRHDVVVGNAHDALRVTGTWNVADAETALRSRMRGENLRVAVITMGAGGCRVVTEEERLRVPAFAVPVTDPTGAGDAFAAGVAYGMARRWDWERVARFANAVAGLAIGALGAQTGLPDLAAVEALLATGSVRE